MQLRGTEFDTGPGDVRIHRLCQMQQQQQRRTRLRVAGDDLGGLVGEASEHVVQVVIRDRRR